MGKKTHEHSRFGDNPRISRYNLSRNIQMKSWMQTNIATATSTYEYDIAYKFSLRLNIHAQKTTGKAKLILLEAETKYKIKHILVP